MKKLDKLIRKIGLKIFFLFLLTTILYSNASASSFKNCLVNNTTDKDKIMLVRWVFSAMSHHPALASDYKVSKDNFIKHEIAVADYLEYVLGTKCKSETKAALKGDQEKFMAAFEFLGNTAFESLARDPNVNKALETWINQLDKNFFQKFD